MKLKTLNGKKIECEDGLTLHFDTDNDAESFMTHYSKNVFKNQRDIIEQFELFKGNYYNILEVDFNSKKRRLVEGLNHINGELNKDNLCEYVQTDLYKRQFALSEQLNLLTELEKMFL